MSVRRDHRRRRAGVAAFVLPGAWIVIAAVSSCSLRDIADLDREANTGADAASVDASGDGGDCARTCGSASCKCPSVAQITVTSPAGTYRIDAYEVTNADYRSWLATNPSLAGQRAECADWNDSYAPGVVSQKAIDLLGNEVVGKCTSELDTGDSVAVTCIDWCDAAAYCTWAKKRLCGRIGATTGGRTIDTTQPNGGPYADATVSEWYRACSGGTGAPFPYGNVYEKSRCNDDNVGPAAVGSYAKCQGGPDGLFDMSGNVGEFEDACTAYPGKPSLSQNCLVRGGAFWQTQDALACASPAYTQYRAGLSHAIGFRCCANPE